MTPGGFVRESVLSLFEGPQRRAVRDRAEALLAAVESLQQLTHLDQLAESASLAVLSLAAASAAAVYFDAGKLGPRLAFAGQVNGSAEALAATLREIAASAEGAPYRLLGGSTTVAAPFRAGRVRGAALARREHPAFDEADGHALAQFVRHLSATAASVSRLERSRRVERIGQAVLDALEGGVLVAVDGQIQAINRAASRLLGLPRESAVGTSLGCAWPELDRLYRTGKPLDGLLVRAGGRELDVT
ncbi:MAG TPA: PAS domain-containing protein, partial [Myxococcales bacterium]|nr:PAS domain-containing protein [Myxococcales bacterium]